VHIFINDKLKALVKNQYTKMDLKYIYFMRSILSLLIIVIVKINTK